MKIMVGSILAGTAFGAATSLANALSSPYSTLGAPLTGTLWAKTAKLLSLLMDAGWSWAALAVAMGWLATTRTRGALAGTLALITATTAYYTTDAYASGAGTDTVTWLKAALLFGPVLGAIGATIRRPGPAGLLAALTVPIGAATQMILMPPRPHITPTPATILAETIVWTAATLGAGWAIHRFRTEKRTTPPHNAPNPTKTPPPTRTTPTPPDRTQPQYFAPT
ncbi:DUF6518 family protein [Streptomyces sudanensis]|uniref:DUF6518 family protein n=1 Tax=Streptomyces sudanensis TaxID=436397 RepID=UPI0020CF9AD3|nr:DUF6518 family protein [Streptomyces sudanensis]MCP9988453.1 DUF6518 family protein [Streptomyces sudanensis]